MATSFSSATVKINGIIGNMSVTDIRGVASVAITLEENGAVVSTYTLTPQLTANETAGEVVMHDKPKVGAAVQTSVRKRPHPGFRKSSPQPNEKREKKRLRLFQQRNLNLVLVFRELAALRHYT